MSGSGSGSVLKWALGWMWAWMLRWAWAWARTLRVGISALLLAGLGSVTPPGAVTVAVLESGPCADRADRPVGCVGDAAADRHGDRITELPAPEGVNPEAPPLCVAVKGHSGKDAGKLSVTPAPVTLLGPKFITTIV